MKMSGTFGFAPMAGKFTQGVGEFAGAGQVPNTAGVGGVVVPSVRTPGLKYNPDVSHMSRSPSESESWTLVLVMIAANSRQSFELCTSVKIEAEPGARL